ncbi:MAG: hypothetical protein KDA75_14265 [Planctomycetaceae bacterium]|nr:hypothetical protein [Planctomycetaceae bacterium]
MKRAHAFLLLVAAGVLLSSQSANASLVSSISQVTGAGAGTVTGTTADGGATVNLSIDVLQLHAPFNVLFGITGTGGNTVRFNVSLTNSATPATNIGNRIYQLVGSLVATTGGTLFGFSDTPAPTPWSQFSPAFDTIYIGGERGHSFELVPGAPAQSITFFADVFDSNGVGSFTLAFTANPEPETIVLASLVCLAFGWLYYRRRQVGFAHVNLTTTA